MQILHLALHTQDGTIDISEPITPDIPYDDVRASLTQTAAIMLETVNGTIPAGGFPVYIEETEDGGYDA